jgi:hypothetical protein
MPNTHPQRNSRRTEGEPRGALIIALVLLACGAVAVFAGLYREPLPDEMLAAYATRWAAIDEATR